jgi:hypothetical protein
VAKTIAKATGEDSNRSKEVHRLGSMCSTGEANTWKTFSRTHINADGSGHFLLKRDGQIIHSHKWGPENVS